MQRRFFQTKGNLSIALMLVGAGTILLPIATELLQIGSKRGFGPMQIRLVVVGFAILVTGIFLATPLGQRLIQQWRMSSKLTVQPLQPASLLLITVWFALLTGLVEVFILADKKFFSHQFIFLSSHVVWMAPLANLVIFAIPAFLLFLVVWLRPGLISTRSVSFMLALLCFLSLLFMFTWFQRYAALVLAVGLAAQTSRVIGAHSHTLYLLFRRTTGWMATLILALAVGVFGWQDMSERRAVASLPPAALAAPNVLLVVLDTVRAQNLSLYNYARPTTPRLEQFSKTGVVFERAIATSSWTIPSHASMFTGRFPHEVLVESPAPWDQRRLDSNYPTLAELFKQRGYLTAGFTANMGYSSYETGLNRGFIHYEDYPVSLEQMLVSSSLYRTITDRSGQVRIQGDTQNRKTAEEVNADFLGWLSHKDQRPFFAFVNYFDAHMPYQPPKPFDTKLGTQKTALDAYDGCIAYLDYQIGMLLDELKRQHLLDNTLVIITSDHGEHFGEHNLTNHGNSLYLPLLNVPLLIVFPSSVPSGKRVSELVTLRDLPSTVVDLLKLNDVATFPGSSLARYWDSTKSLGNARISPLYSELREMKSLIADRYHYIVKKHGREELYDIKNDPFEKQNLADSEEGRLVCARFRGHLETILASNQLAN